MASFVSKTVKFNASVVAQAYAVAPTTEFTLYAQVAVREKIHRDNLILGQFAQRVERSP